MNDKTRKAIKEIQNYICKKYDKYWDSTMVEFVNEVAQETDGVDGNIFYSVITFKYGEDTLTLEGVRDEEPVFDFAVRICNKETGVDTDGWYDIEPSETLKRFTLDSIPQLFLDYIAECNTETKGA